MEKETLKRFLEAEKKETEALRRKLQKLQNPPPEEAIFVWPEVMKQIFTGGVILLVLLTVASIVFDAPLEEIADRSHTPNPSKAPWYFVGLQELLVYFDPWLAGVVLPTMIMVGLMLIPYIDVNLKGIGRFAPKERPFAIGIFNFGMFLWFALIVFGLYFRGTNWDIYNPSDCWRGAQEPFTFRACPESSGNLDVMNTTDGSLISNEKGESYPSGAIFHLETTTEDGSFTTVDYLWKNGKWEEMIPPKKLPLAWTPFKDESGNPYAPDHPYHMVLGLLILGVWFGTFIVVPALLNPIFFYRLGPWRYVTAMFFTASIFGVVGKMVWQLVFGIKYILVTPWLNI